VTAPVTRTYIQLSSFDTTHSHLLDKTLYNSSSLFAGCDWRMDVEASFVGTSDVQSKPRQKHSCSTCARRKVKCDRQEPCTSCIKTKTECHYLAAPNSLPRRRKRQDAPQEDLFARVQRYEELLKRNNIDFTSPDNWIHSGIEVNSHQTNMRKSRPDNEYSTSDKGDA
jgi:hypothetical protein